MNQTHFETICKKIIEKKFECRDDTALFKYTDILINPEMAILLKIDEQSVRTKYEIRAVFPNEYESIVRTNINTIRQWYSDNALPLNVYGYSNESPIKMEKNEYPSGLVAFGKGKTESDLHRYELILLNKWDSKEIYGSYHVWLAAMLLHNYEYHTLIEQYPLALETSKLESHRSEQFVRSLNKDVLPDENYKSLENRISDYQLEDKWYNRILWIGYQIRKKNKGKKNQDLYTASQNIRKLKNRTASRYWNAFKFLKNDLGTNHEDFFRSLKSDLFSEKSEVSQNWRRIASLILEHGWRVIREESLNDSNRILKKDENATNDEWFKYLIKVRNLLEISQSLILCVLSHQKHEKNEGHHGIIGNFSEIGREFLRLYFSLEVIKSDSKLYKRYLNSDEDSVRFDAPNEVKRNFILNLSRFMSGIIIILQRKYLNMHTEPLSVSPTEELDSFLYIIDRYVHVELEVEEVVNIRELITRQIQAEVHYHLTHSHYRDHLFHVIDVFLFGHLLLNTHFIWAKNDNLPLIAQLSQMSGEPQTCDWLKNWAVCSLLHDIGYQLGQGKSISNDQKVWNKYFELNGLKSADWLKFDISKEDAEITSTDRLEFVKNLIGKINTFSGLAECIPENNKFSDDHGVLSALRLAQVLLHSDLAASRDKTRRESKLTSDYFHALHAISHHNLAEEEIRFNTHPLSCLLRLCDELQEWNRRRVNNEKIVKNLYLDIQYGKTEAVDGYEMLESFESNLQIETDFEKGTIGIGLSHERPCFQFRLLYRDSVEENFIPMMTLLTKAYALQQIDLRDTHFENGDLKFTIDVIFPIPKDFRGLSEYDIYGLYTENNRFFPLLEQFSSIEQVESGLIRITDDEDRFSDKFGIIVSRESEKGIRKGWLPVNPSHFFEKYLKFRNDMLSGNRS